MKGGACKNTATLVLTFFFVLVSLISFTSYIFAEIILKVLQQEMIGKIYVFYYYKLEYFQESTVC